MDGSYHPASCEHEAFFGGKSASPAYQPDYRFQKETYCFFCFRKHSQIAYQRQFTYVCAMAEDLELQESDEQDLFEHLRVVVDKGQALLRIDKFLMNRIENASRNRIQNAIAAANVLVNGLPVKPSYKVKPADVISVVLPHPPRDTEIYPENIPLDILYEDDELLVVN